MVIIVGGGLIRDIPEESGTDLSRRWDDTNRQWIKGVVINRHIALIWNHITNMSEGIVSWVLGMDITGPS